MVKSLTFDNEDGSKIMAPDYTLKKKAGNVDVSQIITPERVRRADDVIEKEKEHFGDEILAEVEKLEGLCDSLANGVDKQTVLHNMLDVAINLKSSSAMFGFPLATEFSKSLYQLCLVLEDASENDQRILHAHVDALRNIYVHKVTNQGGPVEQELLHDLESYTEQCKDKKS